MTVFMVEYTPEGSPEELPLNAEFQELVRAFVKDSLGVVVLKYQHTRVLIKQLQSVAASMASLHTSLTRIEIALL